MLGVEDGCACGGAGLGRGADREPADGDGRAHGAGLGGGRHMLRHAMVSLPRPPGWAEVADITIAEGRLTLSEIGGGQVTCPSTADSFG